MEKSDEKTFPMHGNFPADQYQLDTLDPNTGEITFRRISAAMRHLNPAGQEMPDPRPHAPSLGKVPEMHIRDYIKTLVHNERLQQDLDAQGLETFEEANDFEVGEDYFPDSQYENDLEPSVAELIREGTASLSAKARAAEVAAAAKKQRLADQDDSSPPEPSKKRRRRVDPAQMDLEDPPLEAGSGDDL